MANGLPPELLLMVFKFTCFTSSGTTDTQITVRLTHVSRYWRRIAIASQSLWCNISYHSPFGYRRNYIALQRLMTCLARSGLHPLTLHLHIYNPQDEGFQIICEHSTRWKFLSLKCNHSLIPLISTRLRKAPVPNLEFLHATAIPTGREHEDSSGPPPPPSSQGAGNGTDSRWSIFSGGTPRLIHLELGNAAVYYMRPVHLETLSTIHFHSTFNDLELQPSELYAILTIPTLTTLTLLTEFWELIPDIAHISSERILMSQLRYLGIRGQYGSDFEVMRILATLSLPVLEVLMLQNIVGTSLDESLLGTTTTTTDIDAREPEVLANLHALHLVDSCEISSALYPLLLRTCLTLTELVFDTGASESSAIGSLLLPFPFDDDNNENENDNGIVSGGTGSELPSKPSQPVPAPSPPPVMFPELTTLTFRSVDKRDAQNLMIILPWLREQGRPIDKVVLGPELADVWVESGHVDGFREMLVEEIYREEEMDPRTSLWCAPRRTLLP